MGGGSCWYHVFWTGVFLNAGRDIMKLTSWLMLLRFLFVMAFTFCNSTAQLRMDAPTTRTVLKAAPVFIY